MIAYYYQPTSESTAQHKPAVAPAPLRTPDPTTRVYNLSAVTVPDVDGEAKQAILTLQRHQPIMEYLQRRLSQDGDAVRSSEQLDRDAQALSKECALAPYQIRRMLPEDARQVQNLTRPFVIRALCGEEIELHVTNRLPDPLRLVLLDDGLGMQQDVSYQRPIKTAEQGVYLLTCKQAGIYPIYNQAYSENGASRGLLGVLMIEY